MIPNTPFRPTFSHPALMLAAILILLLPMAAQSAVILQYHHVSESSPASTSVTPALFREHMAHLKQAGYRVLPLEDVASAMQRGEPLPDRAVAITFDDGYISVYEEAFPLLRDYDWPFTVFVNTRPVDQRLAQFASWEQLREMAAAGATIANHSETHPHFLRREKGESEARWRERIETEVQRAQERIVEETGQDHQLFAYPYGEYDQATQALLKRLGFVAFGQQSGPLNPYDELQALSRFPFGGPYGDLADFRTKAASLPMPLNDVQLSWEGEAITDTVLSAEVERPLLQLTLSDAKLASRVQCFVSGQGAIAMRVEGDAVYAQAGKALPVGRSRYNCTAPSAESGRYYWYSQAFIRKQPNGEWYKE